MQLVGNLAKPPPLGWISFNQSVLLGADFHLKKVERPGPLPG